MILELIVNMASPCRFLEGLKYVEYNTAYNYTMEIDVNDILLWLMFVRLYNLA